MNGTWQDSKMKRLRKRKTRRQGRMDHGAIGKLVWLWADGRRRISPFRSSLAAFRATQYPCPPSNSTPLSKKTPARRCSWRGTAFHCRQLASTTQPSVIPKCFLPFFFGVSFSSSFCQFLLVLPLLPQQCSHINLFLTASLLALQAIKSNSGKRHGERPEDFEEDK